MNKKYLFLILLMIYTMLLPANVLLRFYHSNHGPVERLVYEFSDYPRFRIREDPFDVNISFLDCGINPEIKTQVFSKHEVVTRVTFVRTDTFIGVLISSYEDYKIEHFIMESENGYKLVMDMFRYKNPPFPEIAKSYTEFYEKVGFWEKAEKYRKIAKQLEENPLLFAKSEPEPVVYKPELPDPYTVTPVETNEEPAAEIEDAVTEPEPEPEVKEVVVEKVTEEAKPEEKAPSGPSISDRLPGILADIYEDRMLMFSIVVVVFIVFAMVVMSVIRMLRRKKYESMEHTSDSFGTKEFQKVTIKRLLSNGWQVEEIAQELNLSPEDVVGLGRGN